MDLSKTTFFLAVNEEASGELHSMNLFYVHSIRPSMTKLKYATCGLRIWRR